MFKLADKYDRRRSGMRSQITRLYNYQWTGVPRSARFDAGLVNPNGSPRKAYRQFKKSARGSRGRQGELPDAGRGAGRHAGGSLPVPRCAPPATRQAPIAADSASPAGRSEKPVRASTS